MHAFMYFHISIRTRAHTLSFISTMYIQKAKCEHWNDIDYKTLFVYFRIAWEIGLENVNYSTILIYYNTWLSPITWYQYQKTIIVLTCTQPYRHIYIHDIHIQNCNAWEWLFIVWNLELLTMVAHISKDVKSISKQLLHAFRHSLHKE